MGKGTCNCENSEQLTEIIKNVQDPKFAQKFVEYIAATLPPDLQYLEIAKFSHRISIVSGLTKFNDYQKEYLKKMK
jgi:hypothetical protein